MSNSTEIRNENRNGREQLWDLIKGIKFAMFVTRHGNGHLHARPMTTQNRQLDADDTLWFFMPRSGDPVDDLAAQPDVNLSYADTDQDRFVSVSGTARVVENMAKKTELWSTMAQAWFPGGVDDPNLALVEVKISHAHFWNVTDSKITQLYQMAKSVVTGKAPTKMGDSGEVRLAADSAALTDSGGSASALARSEKKAHEHQPENFRDEALQDKRVAIPPLNQGTTPIHGLDTK